MNPRSLGSLVDTALDRTVAPGYTRLGLAVRRRLPGWPADPAPDALLGRDVAVTGATSGLGLATALGVARLGARVHLVVRNEAKAKGVVASILGEVPHAVVEVHRCDVSDLDDVRRFTDELVAAMRGRGDRLDVLVHNAGVMPPERTESPQGQELSMACHLLGPVLMTEGLQPVLRGGRVVLVTSGGMYGQALRDDDPDYRVGAYSGVTAYARSKRAQVELLPRLAARWRPTSTWATHPGWADTPGFAESLPGFRRLTSPALRDADEGADTVVWLAATDPAPPSGGLWHDRRERPRHLLGINRPREGGVEAMWQWTLEQTGLED